MALVRDERTRDIVRERYLNRQKSNKILISYHILPEQKQLIDDIADATGKGKAEVVRDILDEWMELQLSEGGK